MCMQRNLPLETQPIVGDQVNIHFTSFHLQVIILVSNGESPQRYLAAEGWDVEVKQKVEIPDDRSGGGMSTFTLHIITCNTFA